MRPGIARIRDVFDYEGVGGSPLLGVRGRDHHPRPGAAADDRARGRASARRRPASACRSGSPRRCQDAGERRVERPARRRRRRPPGATDRGPAGRRDAGPAAVGPARHRGDVACGWPRSRSPACCASGAAGRAGATPRRVADPGPHPRRPRRRRRLARGPAAAAARPAHGAGPRAVGAAVERLLGMSSAASPSWSMASEADARPREASPAARCPRPEPSRRSPAALAAVFEAEFGQRTAEAILERHLAEVEGDPEAGGAGPRARRNGRPQPRRAGRPRSTAAAPQYPVVQLARMDRALLRCGLGEVLHSPATPARVAIAEWVELARTYSVATRCGGS